MRVTCERCRTEYRFDDSRVTEAGVRVKCTRCDHVFLVRRKSFVVTEAVPVTAEEREALDKAKGTDDVPADGNSKHRRWLIRRDDGELLEFKEMTTLQRWIVERRVSRDDEISHNGERWKRLGSIPELETFFAVVEATPADLGEPADDSPAAVPQVDDDDPHDTEESPVVSRQDVTEPPPPKGPTQTQPPPNPFLVGAAVARVEPVPNPQAPPPNIEERTPTPAPDVRRNNPSLPGSYSFPGPQGEYQPTDPGMPPVDPNQYQPPAENPDPTTVQPESNLDALRGERPRKPVKGAAIPHPDDEDVSSKPPRTPRRGRIVMLVLLLVVGGVAVFWWMRPDDAQRYWAEASNRAGGLWSRLTLPGEAVQAVEKGRALLREDAAVSYGEAEAEFRAALGLASSKPFASAAAGLAETLALKDLLEASDKHRAEVARYAQEALSADPSASSTFRAQAYHALLKKDFDTADSDVVKALARDPRDADAYTLRATIYLASESRVEDAREALRQALSIDSELVRANYLMASTLAAAGEMAEAKPYASKAAAASPRHERADALLQQILSGTATPTPTPAASPGESPIGSPIVQVTRKPGLSTAGSVDSLIQRGYAAYSKGRYKEAVRLYEAAVDKKPDHSEAYALLGLAYLKAGDIGSAESALLSAKTLNPRYADTYRYLGMLYSNTGEKDRAIENFKKYLDMRPNGSAAEDVRRRLAALEGP